MSKMRRAPRIRLHDAIAQPRRDLRRLLVEVAEPATPATAALEVLAPARAAAAASTSSSPPPPALVERTVRA